MFKHNYNKYWFENRELSIIIICVNETLIHCLGTK